MKTHDDIRAFWEHRLGADWTETGVGYRALGRPFNLWMYRVRWEAFLREAGALELDRPNTRVLDVGSGTGFYVRGWQHLGVGSVTGCDLTEAAVENLRERFPDAKFMRLDIAEPGDAIEPAGYDAASCMDVLFHIVDDERYKAALASIAAAVRPGGYFVLSENFLHRPVQRGDHQVNRTLEWITAELDRVGFEVQRRVPMLVLMNAQVDAGPVWRKLWGGTLRAATLTNPTGWLAGAALYPLERRLVRSRRESPTTELMICRRREDSAG
ncbi:class I SAM-dependent methyltransferase [Allonocardiopsis opalescens]|uniref:Methyltransferase family protein n=1 Tax=Allonocardiopsis opalescens TaxID=1144618 RepID=A0A2T0Q9A7_9ACTN|nr:class I SAM-dependent methyltransferase [Allonocardiopsis opalescens]PRY00479.1 methyltransferase family protein [Allonocardiopsis opalescens]